MSALRERVAHPAPFAPNALSAISAVLLERVGVGAMVLDPFAGIGRIHQLGFFRTVGVELEPEWAGSHPDTIVGDATKLPFADDTFAAVATSCCYGNRMADHHDAKDPSKRHTYRHMLGRPLSPNSAGAMQWGPDYCQLHRVAWAEAKRVVRPGGWILVNVSNHIRKGVEQAVVEWHRDTLVALGWQLESVEPIDTPRMRHGANHRLRVDGERLIVCRNPKEGS